MIVELVDAELGDRLAPRDAELAFCFGLGGQTVAVPTEASLNSFAAHRAVTRHRIFDIPRQQVAVVRQPIGKRRTVVEDELGVGGTANRAASHTAGRTATLARMLLDRCFKRVVARPIREHLLFSLWQVRLGRDVGIPPCH